MTPLPRPPRVPQLARALALLVLGACVAAPAVAAARPAAKAPTFRQAYERERAQLVAERSALQEQLAQLRQANAAREGELRGEIAQKTAAVAAARRAADGAEDRLAGLQEQQEAGVEREDVVDSTLETAALSIRKLSGRGVSIEGEQLVVLDRVLARGITLVQRLGTFHVDEGSFYDRHGVERQGRILHLGHLAALGIADGAGGVLAHAPGGGWLVHDHSQLAVAQQLADGTELAVVPLHLCDPTAQAHAPRTERTWVDIANAGGLIAWVIVGLAAFVLLVTLERIVTLLLTSSRARALTEGATRLVRASPERIKAELAPRRGALARVMRAVLEHRDAGRDKLEDIAAEAIYREMPRLERLLPILGVVAAAAPLLGLLGTVTGMISTFEVITEHGTGDPKMLSGGISEALITTEFGLILAVPTLLAHHVLGRWSDRILASLQAGSLTLINLLDRPSPAGSSRASEAAGG